MKCIQIAVIICNLLIFNLELWAQITDLPEKRISISIQDVTLKEALKQISSQAGIGFSYSDDLVSTTQKVSLKFLDKSLKDALNQLFSGTNIAYKIVGKQIILQAKKIKPKKYTISGYVGDSKSGERLIYANIYDSINKQCVISNTYGFYSITLPEGIISLKYSYVGYKPVCKQFFLSTDTFLNEFFSADILLAEVVITSSQDKINNTEMGTNSIPIKDIKALPGFLGESDVIRTIQLTPGVKGKEFTNFYVRGGSSDQNLILLDDATVYKYAHLGGIFSVFNTDALQSAKLYKGILPATHGGRLSSMLDLHMREGNNQNFAVSGALGLLFSHLTVEGPLIKNKMSFILSARRSYFDLFFPLASNPSSRKNKASFLDLNAKVNYNLSKKDKLFVSAFNSNDQFSLNSNGSSDNAKNTIFYQSKTFSIRYNHVFSSKLFSNLSLLYTGFNYGSESSSVNTANNQTSSGDWKGNLNDYSLKNDYTWYFNPSLTMQIGGSFTFHKTHVGSWFSTEGSQKYEAPLPYINSLSTAVYINNTQSFGDKFLVEYGLRLSIYNNIGKSFYYKYSKTAYGGIILQDTIYYRKGEIYNSKIFLEPRISLCYKLNKSSSAKLGYNRNTQNIHQISNTTFSTPWDIWYPATPKVKPQYADIVSAGYFRKLIDNQYTVSLETYYKKMHNVIDFKDHAQIIGNPFFEEELAFGNARAYGIEFEARKNEGRFTGWLAYSYSRVFLKIPEINNGKEYPASFDVPHDISVGLIYRVGKRVSISANWVYSSGQATMLMSGYYKYNDISVPYYTGKNAGRLPDYHRLDVGLNIITKRTIRRETLGKKYHAAWNISIINLYNRANPYYIVLRPGWKDPSVTEIQKVYLFGFFPSISYNFNF